MRSSFLEVEVEGIRMEEDEDATDLLSEESSEFRGTNESGTCLLER